MIWRSKHGSGQCPPRAWAARHTDGSATGSQSAGFTLLEMIIVLVILGLAIGLVITRGPVRSHALEVRNTAAQVMETLRLARSRAIARNRPVSVVVDIRQRSYRIDNELPHLLPPGLGVDVVATAEETLGERRAAIRFEPDGSASGGRIELIDGARRLQIGVDWLTGRVGFADAH
jgi:general secretion pathway protein H